MSQTATKRQTGPMEARLIAVLGSPAAVRRVVEGYLCELGERAKVRADGDLFGAAHWVRFSWVPRYFDQFWLGP